MIAFLLGSAEAAPVDFGPIVDALVERSVEAAACLDPAETQMVRDQVTRMRGSHRVGRERVGSLLVRVSHTLRVLDAATAACGGQTSGVAPAAPEYQFGEYAVRCGLGDVQLQAVDAGRAAYFADFSSDVVYRLRRLGEARAADQYGAIVLGVIGGRCFSGNPDADIAHVCSCPGGLAPPTRHLTNSEGAAIPPACNDGCVALPDGREWDDFDGWVDRHRETTKVANVEVWLYGDSRRTPETARRLEKWSEMHVAELTRCSALGGGRADWWGRWLPEPLVPTEGDTCVAALLNRAPLRGATITVAPAP